MALPDCFTSARTFNKFSVLILPERISASKKALWAECTFSSSSSRSKLYALVSGLLLSICSLTNINSLRMWSMIRRCVCGSFLFGFIIWAPALPIAVGWLNCPLRGWPVIPDPIKPVLLPTPLLSSSLAHSLKKTFRKTSSFLWKVSSYLTLL